LKDSLEKRVPLGHPACPWLPRKLFPQDLLHSVQLPRHSADFGIIQVMQVLQSYRGFHEDLKETHGRSGNVCQDQDSCRQPLRGQYVNLWNETKDVVETPGS
jgi:hypothetical protein